MLITGHQGPTPAPGRGRGAQPVKDGHKVIAEDGNPGPAHIHEGLAETIQIFIPAGQAQRNPVWDGDTLDDGEG